MVNPCWERFVPTCGMTQGPSPKWSKHAPDQQTASHRGGDKGRYQKILAWARWSCRKKAPSSWGRLRPAPACHTPPELRGAGRSRISCRRLIPGRISGVRPQRGHYQWYPTDMSDQLLPRTWRTGTRHSFWREMTTLETTLCHLFPWRTLYWTKSLSHPFSWNHAIREANIKIHSCVPIFSVRVRLLEFLYPGIIKKTIDFYKHFMHIIPSVMKHVASKKIQDV